MWLQSLWVLCLWALAAVMPLVENGRSRKWWCHQIAHDVRKVNLKLFFFCYYFVMIILDHFVEVLKLFNCSYIYNSSSILCYKHYFFVLVTVVLYWQRGNIVSATINWWLIKIMSISLIQMVKARLNCL